jgi:PBP1b-binding outer membrane lipoprotein LpoB
MKKYRSIVIAVFAAVLLVGCASTKLTKDIDVDVQAAPGVSVNKYKTYAWVGTAQILNDPRGQWEPRNFDADAEIQYLIDRELRKRGISQVDRNPDILVAYIAGVDMEALELKEDPKQDMEVLQNNPKGTLVVLFISPVNGKALWAGVAVADVEGKRSSEDTKKRLDYAVSEMFRKLPKPQ